nr:sugar ABC transporter substrate-binding protein [Paenibacillus roseus]
MAISGSEQEQKLRYETADLFMKDHPNIKIEWVDIGNERYQKTLTLISGGNPPDILYINDWTLPLATRGVLMPLDDFIKEDHSFNLDEFYPSIIDAYKLDGKLYGLPQDLSPTVIYYNKDLFDQANLPYPADDWTQDDFITAAKKLTNPAKKQYGFILSTWNTEYDGWMLRNGASLFTPDLKKSAVDSPEALKALQLLKQIVVDDHVSPNPAEIQAMGQYDYALFRNRQLAMFSSGLWQLPGFKAEPLPFKWDVVRMPKQVNQATKAGVLSWSIHKDTKHPKEAWEVLKFFVGHEGMKLVAKYSMALPASDVKEANQIIIDSKFPVNVKAFVDSAPLVNMEEFRHPKWSELSVAINEQLDRMLIGNQSPEDTQKNMFAKMNEIMAE